MVSFHLDAAEAMANTTPPVACDEQIIDFAPVERHRHLLLNCGFAQKLCGSLAE
jgi:hypothetical protein